LSTQRYLVGNMLTEADIKLFVTLIRFDEAYVVGLKCNMKTILHDYPVLLNYCRDIYQLPSIAETVDMTHIKIYVFG
jgi:glutathionyl-hydroquinone reductase